MRKFVGRILRRLSLALTVLANKVDPLLTPEEVGEQMGKTIKEAFDVVAGIGRGFARGFDGHD